MTSRVVDKEATKDIQVKRTSYPVTDCIPQLKTIYKANNKNRRCRALVKINSISLISISILSILILRIDK